VNGESSSSAAYYDSLWARSRKLDQHHKCRLHAIEKLLKSLPAPDKGRHRILELGCGSGMITTLLARYGEIVGVDQSAVGIKMVQDRIPGRFVTGILPDIPVPDSGFDLCVLSQVIEHFSDADQANLLHRAYEKVIPKGYLILTTPNRPVSIRMTFREGELQPVENWLTPADLRKLLEKSGWQLVRMGFAFSFFPILTSKIPALRGARYLFYDLLRCRVLLEDFCETWPIGDCTVVLARRG